MDPYYGWLSSFYDWVVFHPPKKTANDQRPLVTAQFVCWKLSAGRFLPASSFSLFGEDKFSLSSGCRMFLQKKRDTKKYWISIELQFGNQSAKILNLPRVCVYK